MPAQSEDDPLSAALQLSFSPVKYRTKMGDNSTPSSSINNLVLDSRIMASASEILSTNIKYSVVDDSHSPNFYSKLKEKYTVLNAANNQIGSSSSSSSSSTSNLDVSSPKTSVTSSTENKKPQSQIVPSIASTTKPTASNNSNNASLPTPKKVLYSPNLVSLGWKGSVPVGAGFVNLGNSCYLNSALQALLHVPAFVNWLLNDKSHISRCESLNGTTHSECLICLMAKVLHNSHEFTGTAIKPMQIYSRLKDICKHLAHGHQEDAHEFLRYLIEGMEKSYLNIFNGMRLDSYSKETTPLNQIFGGYMRTEVTCLECGYISTTFQHFQDLLLDIRQANSMEEALDTYFSRERLGDGDQAYKCGQCKRRAAATKKFSIERPPNALCIQLKRFNAMGGKNNKHISVKQVLDMTRYIHQSRPSSGCLKYKLVSLVSHLGQSANCGHYTAIGLSAAGAYYHFDDNIVRPVPLQNVLNTNAYIIMYELVEKEKTNNQAPVETNGINTAEHNENSLKTNQSSVDKKVSDDKQVVPRLSKQLQASPKRSPQIAAESSMASASSKKVSKNCLNSKDNCQSSSEVSNVECSLVPYLSESSESECGCEISNQATNHVNTSMAIAKSKNLSRPKQQEDKSIKENSTVNSDPEQKEQVAGTSVNWQVSSINNDAYSKESCSTSTAAGKWSIRTQERDSSKQESIENGKTHTVSTAVNTVTTPSKSNTATSNTTANSSAEDGEKLERSKNSSFNSSSPPASSPSTNTVQSLLDMSHQGYGSTNVNSWNGNKSKLSQDVEKDRLQEKRSFDNYNDELDRGKVKRRRYNKNNNIDNDGNNSWNRAQDYQNRKSFWNSPLNGSSRQNFYRQYTYEKSKGHNHHHHHHHHNHHAPYRGAGGNYYRNGGNNGNNFPLPMMSPSVMYNKAQILPNEDRQGGYTGHKRKFLHSSRRR